MAHVDDDELSAALAEVAAVLALSNDRVDVVAARTRELLDGRAAGASYAELLTGASGPLVLDVLSDLQDALSRAGSHLRRVEVRALQNEGLSLEKIARLLRVSRQRVSAIANSPRGVGSSTSGVDHARAAGLSLTDSEFHMIAEALPYVVWVASPDGATEYHNRQVIEYTGLPREELTDWQWTAVIHPEDRERVRAAWQAATESGEEYEIDFRLRRFDGAHRWHRARSLPVRGTDEHIVKWIGTAIDIDETICPACGLPQRG